jgi:hypothetical protein
MKNMGKTRYADEFYLPYNQTLHNAHIHLI